MNLSLHYMNFDVNLLRRQLKRRLILDWCSAEKVKEGLRSPMGISCFTPESVSLKSLCLWHQKSNLATWCLFQMSMAAFSWPQPSLRQHSENISALENSIQALTESRPWPPDDLFLMTSLPASEAFSMKLNVSSRCKVWLTRAIRLLSRSWSERQESITQPGF